MGNTRSSHFEKKPDDVWWPNSKSNEPNDNISSCSTDTIDINEKQLREDSVRKLDEFKLELARKREKRKEIINQKRQEMEELREELQRLRDENERLRRLQNLGEDNSDSANEIYRLRQENETLRMLVTEKGRLLHESEQILDKNRELRLQTVEMQQELQRLNNVMLNFEKERQDYKEHVVALKNVIAVSKNMLQIRETELTELKAKITEIEKSLAEKEVQLLSKDLRSEYERQMANIRDLRVLYEDRQRAAIREKEVLVSQLNDAKKDLEDEQNKTKELHDRITSLEDDSSKKYDEIKQLESNVGFAKAESRQFQAELTVINQLFSEILLGFNSTQEIDLDKLQKHLEQHHDLLQDIVINEVASEASYALPKVLLELLQQVEAKKDKDDSHRGEETQGRNLDTIEEETESSTSILHNQMNSAEEIVENLPKVWRVLIELLSHQIAPVNELSENFDAENPCYKTVETAKGPSVVLSVSQTFIRLKDLILEKKSLEKETNHLKQLNGHLENRLQDQEKRLELVQSELSKTWLMVGKLQKQHQMLHTQEKILRYELAQKRKLLTQLKEELEYSREKWAQAREKNTNTEEQWKLLRTEFASRKNTLNDDANNSAESGYSDDKEYSSSDDEPSYNADVADKGARIRGGETNLNGSTNTLTDITVNSEETKTVTKEDTISVPDLISSQTLHNGADCVESTNVECSLAESGQDSSESTKNLAVEQTWERVSNIVQQEILRLTDHTPKTDYEVTNDERLAGNSRQSNKTDPNDCGLPSTSSRTLEEVLAARNERFKRLEEEAKQLRTKVLNTNIRSDEISNKLDSLHGTYGQSVDSSVEEEKEVHEDDDSTDENRNDTQE